ncbi:MAG: hypothetical protein NZM37_10290 [Sandaracinaceae bacterium]|nr:hypothetical protein [Sandaracinaceae bacterium]
MRTASNGLGDGWFLGILVCLTGALVHACATQPLSLQPKEHVFTPNDYYAVLWRWTRSSDSFDIGRLREVAHITATFESPEFRWAYVVRYAADHSMGMDERGRLLEQSLADARVRHRFLVAIGTVLFREGDLTGNQSDWRVLLIDSTGKQSEPIEIIRIRRPSADLRTYFPFVHRQRHVFRVVFPTHDQSGEQTIAPESTYVMLRFASALGRVDLRWDLEPTPSVKEARPALSKNLVKAQ